MICSRGPVAGTESAQDVDTIAPGLYGASNVLLGRLAGQHSIAVCSPPGRPECNSRVLRGVELVEKQRVLTVFDGSRPVAYGELRVTGRRWFLYAVDGCWLASRTSRLAVASKSEARRVLRSMIPPAGARCKRCDRMLPLRARSARPHARRNLCSSCQKVRGSERARASERRARSRKAGN